MRDVSTYYTTTTAKDSAGSLPSGRTPAPIADKPLRVAQAIDNRLHERDRVALRVILDRAPRVATHAELAVALRADRNFDGGKDAVRGVVDRLRVVVGPEHIGSVYRKGYRWIP